LNRIAKEQPRLACAPNPLLFLDRKQIGEFGLSHRLPTMHAFREFVDAGGLMSYGANTPTQLALAAEQVAKILEGVRPDELPVQQATQFEWSST
jgi:putative ABC transport system substrate-binding protein